MVNPASPALELKLCGERFVAGDVAVLWAYSGIAGKERRAVLEMPRGQARELAERTFRRIHAGTRPGEDFRRSLLKLAEPGTPLRHRHGGHTMTLARPWVPAAEPDPPDAPVLISLGDRRSYFGFRDRSRARSFARRVNERLGSAAPWEFYDAQLWPRDALRFLPRFDGDLQPHGLPDLDGAVQAIVEREFALTLRRITREAAPLAGTGAPPLPDV